MADNTTRADSPDIPLWIWLYLPLAVVFAVLAARLLIPDIYNYIDWVESERGVIENGTAIVLFPAIVLGLRSLRYRAVLPTAWLIAWLWGLVTMALFFAGEEISWGQQWFGWDTPDWILELNRQGEFNLHNMGKQLTSRTPKFIAGSVVILGGVMFPLWQVWRRTYFTSRIDWRYWVAPTKVVVPTAALGVFIMIADRLAVWLDLEDSAPMDIDFGELGELYIAMFLTLYVYSIFRRLRAGQPCEIDGS